MTRRYRYVCGLAAILAVASVAQPAAQTAGERLAFEAASVKRNTSGEPGLRFDILPGGRFVAVNMPLTQLIRAAYMLQLYQIADAPSWVDAERFDISAVADRDLTPTGPWTAGGKFYPVQLMLQSLPRTRLRS